MWSSSVESVVYATRKAGHTHAVRRRLIASPNTKEDLFFYIKTPIFQRTLRDYFHTGKKLDINEKALYLAQPATILLGETGQLVGGGLRSAMEGERQAHLYYTDATSPGYAAPEVLLQYRHRHLGRRMPPSFSRYALWPQHSAYFLNND